MIKTLPLKDQKLYKLKNLIKDAIFLEDIQACKTKKELERYVKPILADIALYEGNFIRFGTKRATSFVIIDVDKVSREHFNDIELYSKFVKSKINLSPNWISKTSRGYHIGFILKNPVWLNNYRQVLNLISIKQYLTDILEADIAGSHRLIGYWRNPITHDSIVNVDKIYTIDDLFNNFDYTPTQLSNNNKTTSKINIDTIDRNQFVEGNRNNFLFKKVIGMLYKGKISNNQVEDTLISLNNDELDLQEIRKISKSIQKYNIQPNEKKKREEYVAGEYHQELWDNGIHNYIDKDTNETEFSRQKMGQKITTAKIIKSTLEKLLNGYIKTYQNREEFTNKNIEKNSTVSKSTIKRYRNQRKLENKIKVMAFHEYLKMLGGESVKANEPTPNNNILIMRKIIDFSLKELKFEYKRTGKKFGFYMENDDNLRFYEIMENVEPMVA